MNVLVALLIVDTGLRRAAVIGRLRAEEFVAG